MKYNVGVCPKCGCTIKRPYPAEYAVCDCSSATLIKLKKEHVTVGGRETKMNLPCCPKCGGFLKHNGKDAWECLNSSCSVIEVKRSWDGKVTVSKRSAI